MIKWIYERDYFGRESVMYAVIEYWMELGYRVFVMGYSAMECREVGAHKHTAN